MFKIKADKAYRDGRPIMSDEEYDKRFGVNASDMDTDLITPLKKVKHNVFMHSLSKVSVSNGFDDIYKWAKNRTLIVSWKYDGLAVELQYVDGQFKCAVTRGDGNIGEDITHNVVKMNNFSEEVDDDFTGSVKAEIVMRKTDYEKYLKETKDKSPYSNTRNGASGAARSLDSKNAHYCTLMYYGVEDDNPYETDYTQFVTLKRWFDHVIFNTTTSASLEQLYQKMSEDREDLDFDVDGIVVAINSEDDKQILGFNAGGRPNFKIAVKFPYYEKETKLRNIIWSNGKTGHITPIAEFDPIDLGVQVEKASLANLNTMRCIWPDGMPKVGDVISVSRRGDVIPKVESLLRKNDSGRILPIPIICPNCSYTLKVDGPFLMCMNVSCRSRYIGNIEHWLNKIKEYFRIHCMGPETVGELFKVGLVKDVSDLYKLQPRQLVDKLSRCGSRLANNMLTFQDYKEIPLHIFLGALNIENTGTRTWDTFITNSKYKSLEEILNLKLSDILLANVEGIGTSKAKSMFDGLQSRRDTITALLEAGINVLDFKRNDKNNTAISGKSFCVTGTLSIDRLAFEGKIKDLGGLVKGVSKKLDYLIVGDSPGATKLSKAEKCNIKIITEDDFNKLLEE